MVLCFFHLVVSLMMSIVFADLSGFFSLVMSHFFTWEFWSRVTYFFPFTNDIRRVKAVIKIKFNVIFLYKFDAQYVLA